MGRIDFDMRWRVMARDEFRCVYCGRTAAEDGVRIVVDHMVPVCAGGATAMDNLVACCEDCNTEKGEKVLDRGIIERINGSRVARAVKSSKARYGQDVLDRVIYLRGEGFGYKRLARELGVSRETARYLVGRAEKDRIDNEPSRHGGER